MRQLRQTSALLLIVLLAACAARQAPASLGPQGIRAWQAQRAVLAFESLQVGVIGLNKVQRCPASAPPNVAPAEPCVPLLSTEMTRSVLKIIDTTVDILGTAPTGWQATTATALAQIRAQLGMPGQQQAAGWLLLIETILKEPPL